MAPGLTSELPVHSTPSEKTAPSYPEPLKLSGALDGFTYEDTTPVIGREFFNVNIVDDLLNAPNADELLRDVAITSNSSPPSSPCLHLLSRPRSHLLHSTLTNNSFFF